jgi:hypothetical protein
MTDLITSGIGEGLLKLGGVLCACHQEGRGQWACSALTD